MVNQKKNLDSEVNQLLISELFFHQYSGAIHLQRLDYSLELKVHFLFRQEVRLSPIMQEFGKQP